MQRYGESSSMATRYPRNHPPAAIGTVRQRRDKSFVPSRPRPREVADIIITAYIRDAHIEQAPVLPRWTQLAMLPGQWWSRSLGKLPLPIGVFAAAHAAMWR